MARETDERHELEEIEVRAKGQSILIRLVNGFVVTVYYNGVTYPVREIKEASQQREEHYFQLK